MISQEEDDELLQDFLIEAGEILDQLSQQIVDLEKSPTDKEIINAVFRGFHTIKGGASFLSLDPMVALCHRTEDVFNAIRNGEREVNSEVMDVVLPVIDLLKDQFSELNSGQILHEVESSILHKLDGLLGIVAKIIPSGTPTIKKRNTKISNRKKIRKKTKMDDSSEEDSILNDEKSVINHKNASIVPDVAPVASDINEQLEDEFDSLLDQFQHERKGVVQSQSTLQADLDEKVVSSERMAAPVEEEITEEEFDALLKELNKIPNKSNIQAKNNSDDSHEALPSSSFSSGTPASVVKKQSQTSKKQTDSAPSKKKPMTKDSAQAETTVRVDTRRLDDIMNLVGELVLVRNRMTSLESVVENEEMSKVVGNLDVVTADLQSAVMKTRMQPIKKVFGRFPRVVRDLARSLKKEISLELQGEDTDLDKNLVEALADPLVHLVRNAVDHGIEMPDEREANGKPRKGTVILTAEQEGDHILLTIQDDGRGMDAEHIRQIAVTKGLLDAESAARLGDREAYSLIFQPGFSTKSEISDLSGRGVGMDVVKTRIEQLNGSVEVDSEKGQGSKIIIKVPLTLAIMPTLMVMLGSQIFALPLASVNEIFHLNLTKTNVIDGQLVVMVRNKALPLFYLRHWLVKGADKTELPDEGHVVVVSMGVQQIGFVVDQLIGQEEVVIKPLGAMLHGMRGMAGATITGDGRISLILDIPGLMQSFARRL